MVGVVKGKWLSTSWTRTACIVKVNCWMVHTLQVFDMLAFKNDIGFWKNKQNVEGLSIKVHILLAMCAYLTQHMWYLNATLKGSAWLDSLR